MGPFFFVIFDIIVIILKICYSLGIGFANSELNAAKEKLEIVIGAAHFDFAQYEPPPFRIFAGGFFRKNAFGLIQEYCTKTNFVGIKNMERFCACPPNPPTGGAGGGFLFLAGLAR